MIVIIESKDSKGKASVFTQTVTELTAWTLTCVLGKFAIDNKDNLICKIYTEEE